MKKLVLAILTVFLPGLAYAEGPPKQSRIASPYVDASGPSYKVHNFEIGVMAGPSWTDAFDGEFKDYEIDWGFYVGYLMRPNEVLGLGIEADAVRTFEADEWLWSLRAKAGGYIVPGVFLYGTGGVAFVSDVDPGWVGGVGVQLDLTKQWSVKLEALRYDFGDVEATHDTVRGGLTFRF